MHVYHQKPEFPHQKPEFPIKNLKFPIKNPEFPIKKRTNHGQNDENDCQNRKRENAIERILPRFVEIQRISVGFY
jgi:hypothetical protein